MGRGSQEGLLLLLLLASAAAAAPVSGLLLLVVRLVLLVLAVAGPWAAVQVGRRGAGLGWAALRLQQWAVGVPAAAAVAEDGAQHKPRWHSQHQQQLLLLPVGQGCLALLQWQLLWHPRQGGCYRAAA